MKKKILFIINEMINGGGQRSLINLLELIDYQQYDVELLLFKESVEFLEIIPPEVKLVSQEEKLQCLYITDIGIIKNIKLLPTNIVHIVGTIISKCISKSGYNKGQVRWKNFYKKVVPTMQKEYDIAVSYLEGESLYYLVDKVNAKRKISFIHTDYSKIKPDVKFDMEYFGKVDCVVGISNKCVEILKETFPEMSDKIKLLPNLISTKSIERQAKQFYPNEYSEAADVIILSIGRLTELKGFDMAIESAYLLKNKGIKFSWFILGQGELKKDLEELIKKYDVQDCVKLLGTRNNPYPYIKYATIVVQTSRYEGKSMVLDEAKILSKPIVVTNYDTVKDQINDEEGIIVDMKPQAISKGIIELIGKIENYELYLREHDYGNEKELRMYYKVFGGLDEDN